MKSELKPGASRRLSLLSVGYFRARALVLFQFANTRKVSCLILSEESCNVLLRVSNKWTIRNNWVSEVVRIQDQVLVPKSVSGETAFGNKRLDEKRAPRSVCFRELLRPRKGTETRCSSRRLSENNWD